MRLKIVYWVYGGFPYTCRAPNIINKLKKMIKKIIIFLTLLLCYSSTYAYTTSFSKNWLDYQNTMPSLNVWDSLFIKMDKTAIDLPRYDLNVISWFIDNNITYISYTWTCAWASYMEDISESYGSTGYNPNFECYTIFSFNISSLDNTNLSVYDWNGTLLWTYDTNVSVSIPISNTGAWIIVNSSGGITVIHTQPTIDGNNNYLTTIFEMLKFIPVIVALASGFYIINRVFQMIPRGWGK